MLYCCIKVAGFELLDDGLVFLLAGWVDELETSKYLLLQLVDEFQPPSPMY